MWCPSSFRIVGAGWLETPSCAYLADRVTIELHTVPAVAATASAEFVADEEFIPPVRGTPARLIVNDGLTRFVAVGVVGGFRSRIHNNPRASAQITTLPLAISAVKRELLRPIGNSGVPSQVYFAARITPPVRSVLESPFRYGALPSRDHLGGLPPNPQPWICGDYEFTPGPHYAPEEGGTEQQPATTIVEQCLLRLGRTLSPGLSGAEVHSDLGDLARALCSMLSILSRQMVSMAAFESEVPDPNDEVYYAQEVLFPGPYGFAQPPIGHMLSAEPVEILKELCRHWPYTDDLHMALHILGASFGQRNHGALVASIAVLETCVAHWLSELGGRESLYDLLKENPELRARKPDLTMRPLPDISDPHRVPPLSTTLLACCHALRVPYSDVVGPLPSPGIPFIELRHSYLHGKAAQNHDELATEGRSARCLASRLLLAVLGCDPRTWNANHSTVWFSEGTFKALVGTGHHDDDWLHSELPRLGWDPT